MLFQKLKARWYQRKINRWLGYKEDGLSTTDALRKAGLTPPKALSCLEGTLNHHLSRVGIIVLGGSEKDSFSTSQEQTALILNCIASLVPVLPDNEKQRINSLLQQLRGHSWGYIRRAADEALASISAGGIAA